MKKNILTKSVMISCFLAGCLEMYDFVIFGFLAPIIHKNYLSFLDESTSLIITYTLFAVGFLFRPFGALIFGYIGDVYGRKPALVLSVTLMGTASLGMCLLPPYEVIGISACYIIALIRIIQGISVGGEYNGATIFAIEYTDKKNIGFVGATVTAGSTLGVLIATFVSRVLQNPNLPEYSWRFAFLFGFGLSILGYVIRKKLRESPVFEQVRSIKKEVPIFQGIKLLKKEILAAIFVSGANNANFYFSLIFIPNYLKTNHSADFGFLGIMMTSIMFILVPLSGLLSDKINRSALLIGACICMVVYNLFFLDLLMATTNAYQAALYGVICAVIMSSLIATANVFVLEIFPAKYRYSCATLSYSLGAAIFGGTAPLVSSLIIDKFGNVPIYLGASVSFISVLGSLGGLLLLNRKNGIT